jgi:hypothetical protein
LILGKPPALPGDSRSLTIPGIKGNLLSVNRSKFTGKEASVERQPKFKPYIMGMQVSCCMDTEVQEKGDIRRVAEVFRVNIQRPRKSEGESNIGRPSSI